LKEGLVIKSTGSLFTVKTVEGDILLCKLKGRFKIKGISSTSPVVVGDKVGFDLSVNSETGLISKVYPRKNYIVRKSKKLSKMSHVIASNIDNCLIIATLINPKTSLGFLDRVLFTAEAYHINPIIIYNKTDIYDDELQKDLKNVFEIYTNAGYKCLGISALKGDNIGMLKDIMKDKVNMFIGHSGVGKSAIINTLEPGLNLKTGEISVVHETGMHTTTFAEMHTLTMGGFIIDTPGVKEFSLIDFDKAEVAGYFPDMYKVIHNCRFKNCRHISEPGCAVKEAVEKGMIANSRYNSYISIMTSDETEIKYED
jgi:ribosome biogenesis GTPase / thiamine phosphate phosphatase